MWDKKKISTILKKNPLLLYYACLQLFVDSSNIFKKFEITVISVIRLRARYKISLLILSKFKQID